MQDIRAYIDKLVADADACLAISQAAANPAKQKIFLDLADIYRRLSMDLEKIAETNALADEQRDGQLLNLLGGSFGQDRA